MMSGPFFAEIGQGKENGNHQGREELEIGGGKAGPDNDGQNEVVSHSTQSGGKQPHGKVFPFAEECFADDHGGQTNDDGAASHIDIGVALILGQQRTGEAHQTIGEHQTKNLHAIGGNALGPGHVLIIAGGPDSAAQLGTKEPVQQGNNSDDKNSADQNGLGNLGAGKQQFVLGTADGKVALSAHDVHIDGIERQLGKTTGEDCRDACQQEGAQYGDDEVQGY